MGKGRTLCEHEVRDGMKSLQTKERQSCQQTIEAKIEA